MLCTIEIQVFKHTQYTHETRDVPPSHWYWGTNVERLARAFSKAAKYSDHSLKTIDRASRTTEGSAQSICLFPLAILRLVFYDTVKMNRKSDLNRTHLQRKPIVSPKLHCAISVYLCASSSRRD